jgi:hypothetical protein
MGKKITMPPTDAMKKAYTSAAATAGTAYKAGIDQVQGWLAAASSDASEANWKAGVIAAANENRRASGLKTKTSDVVWKMMCSAKGVNRIGTGMTAAADKQSANYAPYAAALAALELQDKTPGDPLGNLQRNAGRVVATLVNVKRQKEGASTIAVP